MVSGVASAECRLSPDRLHGGLKLRRDSADGSAQADRAEQLFGRLDDMNAAAW
jgi:hypothetical protein